MKKKKFYISYNSRYKDFYVRKETNPEGAVYFKDLEKTEKKECSYILKLYAEHLQILKLIPEEVVILVQLSRSVKPIVTYFEQNFPGIILEEVVVI